MLHYAYNKHINPSGLPDSPMFLDNQPICLEYFKVLIWNITAEVYKLHLEVQYAAIESVQYELEQFSGITLIAVLTKKSLFAAGQLTYTDH